QRKLSRGASTLVVTGVLVLSIGGFLLLTWSSLSSQWQYLSTQLTTMGTEAARHVPSWMYPKGESQDRDVRAAVQPLALGFAQSAATALTLIVLGFFVTIYLLIDGRSTLKWVVAFFPQKH